MKPYEILHYTGKPIFMEKYKTYAGMIDVWYDPTLNHIWIYLNRKHIETIDMNEKAEPFKYIIHPKWGRMQV